MREHQMPSFYLFYYTETLIMAQTSLTCHFWCTEPQWKLMTELCPLQLSPALGSAES